MAKSYNISQGKDYPLGSDWDGEGVNFTLFSKNAARVELCLFDGDGKKEIVRINVPYRTGDVWHLYVKGLKLGQLYGYRVYGDYKPYEGKKFNPNKLLLDPYAKAIVGECKWHDSMYAYNRLPQPDMGSFSSTDSAPFMPKAMVVDDIFEWQGDELPKIAWNDTILYEVNVKGLTRMNDDVPESQRGKFAALAGPAMLKYYKKLGITSLELMPCQNFFTNQPQMDKGVSNYWGYDSLCFFAPYNAFLANGEISEFKEMVKTLHQEGIEVILDVVFNHTTESNAYGPTLAYKGIDNAEYYKPLPQDRNLYIDDTGCGATFNVYNPYGLRLVMDAMRYWAEQMHVDGFRFDLATTLCRGWTEVEAFPAFLKTVMQDPVLNKLKLIAEPWDLGPDGYRLGFFPKGWGEWNDKFRDTLRKFWAGKTGQVRELANRMAGSADVLPKRGAFASVNYITAHDGFTLEDLVSFNVKHNEANGENNHDGMNENYSWNTGVEGETKDKKIIALRNQRKKSLFASLVLAAGTPMVLYGDEQSRTQKGNNNTYCQDNETAWLHWDKGWEEKEFFRFVQDLIGFRRANNIFNMAEYVFFAPSGKQMTEADWAVSYSRSLAFTVQGKGKVLFAVMNAYEKAIKWNIPSAPEGKKWKLVFDTKINEGSFAKPVGNYTDYLVPEWSCVLFAAE